LYLPVYTIIEITRETIPETATMAQATATIIENAWNWFPIIELICLVIAVAVYTQRREARSSVYG